jgi:membrane-bound ClpP family serine protease
LIVALAVIVLLLWRHKKAGMGRIELIGRNGTVESALEPEGAVIVDGEVWRARARGGATLRIGERVRVVGASGHLLEVERATT